MNHKITAFDGFFKRLGIIKVGIEEFYFTKLYAEKVLKWFKFRKICFIADSGSNFKLTGTFSIQKLVQHLRAQKACHTCDDNDWFVCRGFDHCLSLF